MVTSLCLYFTPETHAGCGGNLTATHGNFSSPGYRFGRAYPNNVQCDYLITVTPGAQVQINFEFFDVGKKWDENCDFDKVEVTEIRNQYFCEMHPFDWL